MGGAGSARKEARGKLVGDAREENVIICVYTDGYITPMPRADPS